MIAAAAIHGPSPRSPARGQVQGRCKRVRLSGVSSELPRRHRPLAGHAEQRVAGVSRKLSQTSRELQSPNASRTHDGSGAPGRPTSASPVRASPVSGVVCHACRQSSCSRGSARCFHRSAEWKVLHVRTSSVHTRAGSPPCVGPRVSRSWSRRPLCIPESAVRAGVVRSAPSAPGDAAHGGTLDCNNFPALSRAVFNIGPRPSQQGYQAGLWSTDAKIWEGRLR